MWTLVQFTYLSSPGWRIVLVTAEQPRQPESGSRLEQVAASHRHKFPAKYARVPYAHASCYRNTVTARLANSDDCGLTLSLNWTTSQRVPPMRPRTVWKYRDADFQKAKSMIDAIDWNSVLPDDPDLAAIIWQSKFLDIMAQCIPTQYLPRRRRVPWLTKNVMRHIRKRNAAFNKAKRTNFSNPRNDKSLRNKVTSMLRKKTRILQETKSFQCQAVLESHQKCK